MTVRNERLTVQRDEGFVVFMIGARINRWWMLPVIWAVSSAFNRMMKDLLARPELGLLSYEGYGGRTTLMVQYWKSLDHLHAYAHAKQEKHVPAWRRWVQKWGNGIVGIWHETYVIEPGQYETVYHHMPAFGLGKVGPLVPAVGPLKTAAKRLAAQQPALRQSA